MGQSVKKLTILALASFVFTTLCAAQAPVSAEAANRQTAIRCLEQCKVFSAKAQWDDTYLWAGIGIQYDSTIPDLWYLYALSASSLGKPGAEVLSYVSAALADGQWIQYNKSAARLLYANLLSDTLEWTKALAVLNEEPALETAEAEFIRAKTWYRLGNPARARAVIKRAAALFPADERFPLLFFKTERNMKADTASLELAAYLVSVLQNWEDSNPDITLYAAPFIPFQEERNRFVRSYYARGGKNQLYPVLALQYGLISETAAFDLVKESAKEGALDYDLFCEFVENIETNAMRIELQDWLAAFAGTLAFDTNRDGINDLAADYDRGRVTAVRYEKNQDGIFTWQAICDFGVPVSIQTGDKNVFYAAYPLVRSVTAEKKAGREIYELTAAAFSWSPLVMAAVQTPPLMKDFFIPVPKNEIEAISERSLAAFAGSIQTPTEERPEGLIRFTMLNGRPVSAVYTTKGQPYAFAAFENGIPKFRNVDADGNGFYELTEIFAFDQKNAARYRTEAERQRLEKILFGPIQAVNGVYVAKITADLTGNGEVDYESVTLPWGGYSARWKAAAPSGWNLGYVKRAVETADGEFSGKFIEESFFINPVTREETTVAFEAGEPVSVRTNRGKKAITKDPEYNLYWIGAPANGQTAKKIIETLNLYTSPTVSIVENYGNEARVLAVSFGSVYFGEIF